MKKFGIILFSLGVGFLCAQEKAPVQLKVIPVEPAPQVPAPPPATADSAPDTPPPSPEDFSEAKITEAIQAWKSPTREHREMATQFLKTWVESNPAQAKKRLLSILREDPQPEARERSVELLKIVAASEFDKTGDGYIGVAMELSAIELKHPQDLSTLIGLAITAVSPSSPAEKSGLKPGDIVVSLDGFRWRTLEEIVDEYAGLRAKIRAKGAGATVVFEMMRKNEIVKIPVTLKRRPANLERLPFDVPNFNGLRGGAQLGLAQGLQFDKKMIDDLVAEEKNSSQYFQEWLKLQEQVPTAK